MLEFFKTRDDVDPDLMLFGNCGSGCACDLFSQDAVVNRLALLAARLESDETLRSWKASSMRGQYSPVAADWRDLVSIRHREIARSFHVAFVP